MNWIEHRRDHINAVAELRARQHECQGCGAQIERCWLSFRLVPEYLWSDPDLEEEEQPVTFWCSTCAPNSKIKPSKSPWLYPSTEWESPWWKLIQWAKTGDEYERRCVVIRIPGGYIVFPIGHGRSSTALEEELARSEG